MSALFYSSLSTTGMPCQGHSQIPTPNHQHLDALLGKKGCSMLGNHLRALRLGHWNTPCLVPIYLTLKGKRQALPCHLAPSLFSLSCLCLAFYPSGSSSFNPGCCPQAGWVHLPLLILGEGKLVLIPFPCLHSAPSLPSTTSLRASLLEPSAPLPRCASATPRVCQQPYL